MLDDDAGIFKALFGVHLDFEVLTERRLEFDELLPIGREHFAVAVGIVHADHVAVHVEADVDKAATVFQNGVVGAGVARGVDVVPVHFEAHAVVAVLQIGRHDKGGRIDFAAIGVLPI